MALFLVSNEAPSTPRNKITTMPITNNSSGHERLPNSFEKTEKITDPFLLATYQLHLLQRCCLFSQQDDRRVGIEDGQGGSSTATAHREREDGVRPQARSFLRSVHCWSGDWYLHRPAPGISNGIDQSALFFTILKSYIKTSEC